MSQTSLQVCFNNKIQTINLIPSNIEHLLEIIQETYNDLPSTWRLQYQNINKELLDINTQQDYKELLLNLKTAALLVVNIVSDIPNQGEIAESGRQLECEKEGEPDFFSEESFSLIEDDKNEANEIKSLSSSSSQILNSENMDQNDQDSSNDFNVLEGTEKKPFEVLEYSPVPVQNILDKDQPSPCRSEPSGRHDEKEIVNQIPPQNAINDIIDKSIALKVPEIAMLVKEYLENNHHLQSSRADESVDLNKSIHSHYYCNQCGADPIVGARYKCSVCSDFDICENCEKTVQHPHLFLKINHPKDIEKLRQPQPHHHNKFASQSLELSHSDIMREKESFTNKSQFKNYKYHPESEEDDKNEEEEEEEYEEGDSQYEYEYEDEEEEGESFNLKGLGKKLKETTLVKVLSGTYGQLPGQAMNAISNFFGSFKEPPTSSDDEENFSDEDDEEEYY